MNKKEYFVDGMHCPSCELYIETQFKDIKGIKNVKSDNKTQKLTLEIEDNLDIDNVIKSINKKIDKSGYSIQTELTTDKNSLRELTLAFLLSALFILIFWYIQKLTIGDSLFAQEISYPVIFMIGVVASISSCMAVVGSLVLSISSVYAKEEIGKKPMILFHVSRVVGFFILGGVLGIIGSLFLLSKTVEIIIGVFLFLVMIILGINLLNISPWFRKLELILPKGVSRSLFERTGVKNVFTPILLGVGTFFLPCGFTQAMQLNAVFRGTFLQGGLTMFVFALGTLPVLLLITFGSRKITQSKNSSFFLKTAGFLVIFFALYNLIGVLVANGVIPPIF